MTLPENFNEELKQLEQKLTEAQAHELREQKFAVEANERFSKNLAAFELYYPDVFKAIQEFQPREDFCLHVTKSGHGNFIPNLAESPLYNDDPLEQSKLQLTRALTSPDIVKLKIHDGNKWNLDCRLHIRYMEKLSVEINEFYETNKPKLRTKIESNYPTVVFFGLGLGYQFQELVNSVSIDHIFLVEPDIEVFFASLFCIDWHLILEKLDSEGKCLFLLLGATRETFIEDIYNIVDDIGPYSVASCLIIEHFRTELINDLVSDFRKKFFSFHYGFGFYNDAVTGIAHTLSNLENSIPIFTKNKIEPANKETPVFVIGNGPSLDLNLDYIKKNSKKAIIIAAGSALGSLIKNGVIPDFHVLLERPFRNFQIIEDLASKETLKQINLLAVNTVFPDTFDLYSWSGMTLKGAEASSDFLNLVNYSVKKESAHFISYCNPLVSNTALSYALELGFKNIYLFGVDNGTVHDKLHSDYSIYNQGGKYGYNEMKLDSDLVPGNFGKEVKTNNTFRSSISQFEKLVKLYPDASIYHVGDGAKINGVIETLPTELLDLVFEIEKNVIIDSIKNKFEVLNIDKFKIRKLLNVDATLKMVDELLEISGDQVNSLQDCLSNLKRQERYLYAYRDTIERHNFNLLKGSLLYYHTPIISELCSLNNEVDILNLYHRVNVLWRSYLRDIREDYPKSVYEVCDWGMDLTNLVEPANENDFKVPVLHIFSMAMSGETLLLRALSAHPQISIVHNLREKELLEDLRLFNYLRESKEQFVWGKSKMCLHKDLKRKDILVLKQGVWEHDYDYKGISLIRDPRAIFSSLISYDKGLPIEQQKENFKTRILAWAKGIDEQLFSELNKDISNLERFVLFYNRRMAAIRDDLSIFRYEDMCENPREVLTKIVDDLGLPQNENVFNSHLLFEKGKKGHGKIDLSKPINSQSLNNWKSVLSKKDIDYINEHCGYYMKTFGYSI